MSIKDSYQLNTIYSDQQLIKNHAEIKSQEITLFKENPNTTKDAQRVKLEKINHVPKKSNLFTNAANNVGLSRSIDTMVVDQNVVGNNKQFHS